MKLYTNNCTYDEKEFSGHWNKEQFNTGNKETSNTSKSDERPIFFKKAKKKNGGDYGQK
ncbi:MULTISPECIES: hypothetical protein [unclassified Streptococcus]|uniref:hypothetical protein n=1 Tax=unclassified Streptococcus TaxID=2608887 RepID=UPI00359D024B